MTIIKWQKNELQSVQDAHRLSIIIENIPYQKHF